MKFQLKQGRLRGLQKFYQENTYSNELAYLYLPTFDCAQHPPHIKHNTKPVVAIIPLKSKDILKPKQCPNCNEPNKPDSEFCAKCRMVLTYDAYNETRKSKREGIRGTKITRNI